MPYIIRNESGAVSGLLRWPQKKGQELLPDDHPDVEAFRTSRLTPAPEIGDDNGHASGAARQPVDGAAEGILPDEEPEILDVKQDQDPQERPEPAVENPLAALLIRKNFLTPQEVNDAFGYPAPPPRPPRTSDALAPPTLNEADLTEAIDAINARRAARGESPV